MVNLKNMTAAVSRYVVRGKGMSRRQFEQTRDKLIRKAPPPTFWLFGKTGSGKSSIIKFLTGASRIQIGDGFRPTTRHTDLYEFPDANMPMLRFMDTRGLGEPGYDPTEDIAAFENSVHAMIVTQKVMDFAVAPVLNPLKQIRRHAPAELDLQARACPFPRSRISPGVKAPRPSSANT